MKSNIAVIGAGVAGLACARRLMDLGHDVTVFERAGAAGGRIATMRTEIGSFDHGAQYFTARDPAFLAEANRWSAAGIVEPWPVSVQSLGAASGKPGSHAHVGAGTSRWVGVPGMSAIASHLASGLDMRFDARIVQLDPVAANRDDQRGESPRWSLHRREGDVVAGTDAASPVTEGLFDGVVVAVPAEPAAVLLNVAPELAHRAAGARIEPCWALMLGFTEPIESDANPTPDRDADSMHVGDAAFIDSGRLAWIARESSKPARRLGERWTVHAQSAWSVEHFDDDPEDVKTKLLRAFHEATGTAEQPIYAAVHRWRHALVRTSLACDFLWDGRLRVGACGDWCRGHRVEDAWRSGVALADAIAGSS